MREYYKLFITFGLVMAVVVGAVGPAVAHEKQTVEGYDLTFGGADEPVITGERMWLELEIADNETGELIGNQSETLKISVQKSDGEKVGIDVSEKHGEPGVYRVPVIFTEPGDYVIHVEGSIEGTEFHAHFEKEVQDASELEYPGNESTPDDDQNESASDDSQNESTDDDQTKESGFVSNIDTGVAIVAMGAVAIVGMFLLRRGR